MHRRGVAAGLRLLARELQAESAQGGRQMTRLAARSASVAPALAGALRQQLASPTSSQQPVAGFASESYYHEILYPESELEVGSPAPEFTAQAVVDGEIKSLSLSDYKGKYVLFFWYPKDFTFVCPTEIIAFSDRAKEFEALDCSLIAASTDTPETHLAWIKTARKRGGLGFMQIPIVADVTKEIAARYGVLKKDAGIALRGLYIINPEGVVEHVTINNFPIGRNVDEALRTLQAVQYVAEHGEVCPAGWKPGDKTMVADAEKSLEYFESLTETGQQGEAEPDYDARLAKVASKKDYEALIASEGPTVVKFWAPWCGKCRMIAPMVDQLAEEHPGVRIGSFDTTEEKLEVLAADIGVTGLPQFRFYKGGKEVMDKIVGYKKGPLADAIAKLEKM